MTAPTDPARHPRLFDSFADHDAVFLELFSQNGVKERVATRIQRQYEDGEDFRFLQRHYKNFNGRKNTSLKLLYMFF